MPVPFEYNDVGDPGLKVAVFEFTYYARFLHEQLNRARLGDIGDTADIEKACRALGSVRDTVQSIMTLAHDATVNVYKDLHGGTLPALPVSEPTPDASPDASGYDLTQSLTH